jgi:hypothetical protein
MLFLPERHEPLTTEPWSEAKARAALARIVDETNAAFSPQGLWPIHPQDVSPERPPDCMKMLYNGAAGVIWALHELAGRKHAPLVHDFLPIVLSLTARHQADLTKYEAVRNYIGHEHDAYLFGETGLDLLEWKLAPSPTVEDRLVERIARKIGDNRGIVWGGAGTMLAALFLHAATNESRWKSLFLRHADALWTQWDYDAQARCHLWTVDLYGQVEKRLTPLHGFFANAGALLRGEHLLPADRRVDLRRRVAETMRATAIVDNGAPNWPVSHGSPLPRSLYLQFCNGAPGVIASTIGYELDSDDLLIAGGNLAWSAGPVTKPPSLCHGAPSAGYAFLKLHAHTGNPQWLAQARRFAMHAIAQSDAAHAAHGQRKFSLWTGDLGLALFLADCLDGRAAFPTLDYFQARP